MDANQRSEVNNQTNNGANEKWTPGSKGASTDNGQPLDHTYPQALGAHQGNQGRDLMGTPQRGVDPAVAPGGLDSRTNDNDGGIPGASTETRINGGSGTVQGVTDSHQRQMEQKSGAYGMVEQPVGHHHRQAGTELPHQGGNAQRATAYSGNGQSALGGNAHVTSGNMQSATGGTGDVGGQEAQRGNTQQEVAGSRTMANQNSDAGGVHESNDLAGGLPRSPGNVGADSTSRVGSQTGPGAAEGGPEVHESNDAAGGYPRSPGYANKLNGDSNMDDDTGFKRK